MKKYLITSAIILLLVAAFFIFCPQKVKEIKASLFEQKDSATTSSIEIDETLIPVTANTKQEEVKTLRFSAPVIEPNEWFTAQFWRNASVNDVQQKIYSGANVQDRNIQGISILMFAVSFSTNPDVIDILLSSGAQLNTRSEKGQTALMFAAAFNSNPLVIQRLIDRGAQLNTTDKRGWSALMYAAARNPHADIIHILYDNGADVNEKIKNIERPIKHASLANKFIMTVKLGIRASRDILVSLVNSRSTDDIVASFDKGIDNVADSILNQEEDMTALMLAARDSSSPEVLNALLEDGAIVKLYDKKGQTALDYAKSNPAIYNTDIYWKMNDLLY